MSTIRCFPIPFGTGQVAFGGQRSLAGVVATGHDTAFFSGLDNHLGPVDMAGQHVTTLVDQAVGSFCFLDRQRPVTGEDHGGDDARVHRAGTHGERVQVAQHLRHRFGGDEPELFALAHVPGNHAVEVLRFIDVTEKAPRVHRVATFLPQTTAVRETYIRVLFGDLDHVRFEIAERGRENQCCAVLTDHGFHGLLYGNGFRNVFFLDHFDVGQRLDDGRCLGVGLVVTKVVASADVNKTHYQRCIG